MKCQKCGAEMVSGHLYCDICGAEYQIVPNFEPEIENSIAQSLYDIRESMDEEKTFDKVFEDKPKTLKVPSFSLIFFLVLILSVLVYVGYSQYTHSIKYQNTKALEAVSNYDYYKAAQIYENIRKNNPQDAYWYIKEAEINLLLEDKQKAYNLAVFAIDLEENKDIAYDFLLSYLEREKNYIEMMQYLKNCTSEEIKNKYWEYLCEVPPISHESGTYNNALDITFEDNFHGTIYYTLDNTIPDSNSLKYESTIKLGNGTHVLKVVYENNFGIVSEPVAYEYRIISETPMAPIVTISSGTYDSPEFIKVAVEEGTKVYYTTDMTAPTLESQEYVAPIPMPLGQSRFNFIAISEKGISGEITQRNFMLNMKTSISIEEAENILVQKLISTGHILDKNGAVENRYGVFRYFYKFPISFSGINYYVFEEHYMENQINNPLQHFYAVDVFYGHVYKLIYDRDNNFIKAEF